MFKDRREKKKEAKQVLLKPEEISKALLLYQFQVQSIRELGSLKSGDYMVHVNFLTLK